MPADCTDVSEPQSRENVAFWCRACLEDMPASETSPDPRYCRKCYDFLRREASGRGAENGSIKGRWIPRRGGGVALDLSILPGDRVQVVNGVHPVEGMECWFTVDTVQGEGVHLNDIPCSHSTSNLDISIYQIFEHQIKEERMETKNLSPEENLKRCREKLAGAMAANADPRVIGLWKSKVTHAEKLCDEAKPEAKPVAPVVAPAVAVAKPAPKRAGKPKPEAQSCKCGCCLTAAPGRNFLPGHDAKFASYIRKLDQGLVAVDALPQPVQEMVNAGHELVARAREHNKLK